MAASEKSDTCVQVQALVEKWLSWDNNEKTRNEIIALNQAEEYDELQKRLGKRIAFGTAGLRGRMQAGFNSMNDLTVLQASQGLCTYLLNQSKSTQEKGIVIGYDGRHNSLSFAHITAAVFLSKEIPVYMFSEVVPTPFVPYGVVQYKAVAGIMITASHNPKDDNGYKVYWHNGAQIVSPHDKGISNCIEENLKPWALDLNQVRERKHPQLKDCTSEIADRYYQEILKKCSYRTADQNKASGLQSVFTPMHGVGGKWAVRAFETFGLPPFFPVKEQFEPDPNFSTVTFPNPEEGKGALALATKTAVENGASLVLANDPDSDRLAVAELDAQGDLRVFTGNEIGIMLGGWIWQQFKKKNPDIDPSTCCVLNTTVSSKMLSALAKKEGLYYEETLTGFKWLGNRAESLMKDGYHFIFAFEEAIGFMIGDVCLDKDGIRALGAFGELASALKEENRTVSQYLESLREKYGYFATNNRYFFCYDPSKQVEIFERHLRCRSSVSEEPSYPKKFGRFAVQHVRDLTTGHDTTQKDGRAILPTSATSQMITFYFENGCVLTLRGSGTEPKLKYYAELSGPLEDRKKIDAELDELLQAVIAEGLHPEKYNLKKPSD